MASILQRRLQGTSEFHKAMGSETLTGRKAEADIAFSKAARLMQGGRAHRDPTQAACFLHEAAALGHARAQYNLALMYLKGVGVSKSLDESLRWLEEAARNQEPHAIAMLALFNPELALELGAPAELVPLPDVDPLDPDGLQSGKVDLEPSDTLQPQPMWKRARRWMFTVAATLMFTTLLAAISWARLRS
jgi:TPR repeat protein